MLQYYNYNNINQLQIIINEYNKMYKILLQHHFSSDSRYRIGRCYCTVYLLRTLKSSVTVRWFVQLPSRGTNDRRRNRRPRIIREYQTVSEPSLPLNRPGVKRQDAAALTGY